MRRIKAIGRELERFHNWASDSDFVWFPFVWLKPKSKKVLISRQKSVMMALLFGTYGAVLFGLKNLIFNEKNFFYSLGDTIPYFILGFLVWFNAVTLPLWNRRAIKENAF